MLNFGRVLALDFPGDENRWDVFIVFCAEIHVFHISTEIRKFMNFCSGSLPWLVAYQSVVKSSVKKTASPRSRGVFLKNPVSLMTQKLDMFISLLGDFTVAANETWKGQSFYLCQGRSTPYIGDRFVQPLMGNPYVSKSLLQAQAWSHSLPQENNGSLQYTPRKLHGSFCKKTCILPPPCQLIQ